MVEGHVSFRACGFESRSGHFVSLPEFHPGGEIGRRAVFRWLCLRACGFESRSGYKTRDYRKVTSRFWFNIRIEHLLILYALAVRTFAMRGNRNVCKTHKRTDPLANIPRAHFLKEHVYLPFVPLNNSRTSLVNLYSVLNTFQRLPLHSGG